MTTHTFLSNQSPAGGQHPGRTTAVWLWLVDDGPVISTAWGHAHPSAREILHFNKADIQHVPIIFEPLSE